MPKKFWEIRNLADANEGELLIYGDLSDTTWWGDEVTPSNFNNDLESIGQVDTLNVRINSYGGDVFAGHAIYNSIRNFKKKYNCDIKVHVDGIAASSASVVAQAGDKVIMPANTMMMIHDPMIGLCGYMNETDLNKYLEALKPIKDSIIEVYHGKTGMDKKELSTLMVDNGKWMTAAEAIELGFADVMDDEIDLDVQMKTDNQISINDVVIDCKHKNMPKQFMNMAKKPIVNHQKVQPTSDQEEEVVKNIEDLKNKHPEIYQEVYNAGLKAGEEGERSRIQSIENIARPGAEELVNQAKYEKPVDAGTLAVQMIEADKKVKAANLAGMKMDAQNLGKLDGEEDPQINEAELVDKTVDDMVNMINR